VKRPQISFPAVATEAKGKLQMCCSCTPNKKLEAEHASP